MGEGGYLALLNGTPYTWKRTQLEQFQMVAWDFPSEVQPGAYTVLPYICHAQY